MKLPKISRLDLRSLDVIVAEHNARGGLQLRVWRRKAFEGWMG
jgi:hypothetical protein